MAKQNNLNSIEEQIKKLQEKKRSLQEKQEKDVGKYLLKSWDISSLEEKDIFKLIDLNKPNSPDSLPDISNTLNIKSSAPVI